MEFLIPPFLYVELTKNFRLWTLVLSIFVATLLCITFVIELLPRSNSLFFQDKNSTCASSNCWNGINPGSTTVTEAQHLLDAQYGAENVVVTQHDLEFNESLEGWLSITEQGIVDSININLPHGKLAVRELFYWIGEPSFVYTVVAFSDEVQCAGALISYPDIGVHAYLYPQGSFVGVRPAQYIQKLR